MKTNLLKIDYLKILAALLIVANASFASTPSVTEVATGEDFTCAVRGKAAYCWGKNDKGQLGNGTTTGSIKPVLVRALGDSVVGITAGTAHACAILENRTVQCWGLNDKGQLGGSTGTASFSATPIRVGNMPPATVAQISAGGKHTCAVFGSGAFCWGDNSYGQLGNPSITGHTSIPTLVSGMNLLVRTISAGATMTCATQSSVAKCWGVGRLGNGSTSSTTPVTVRLTGGLISSISVGETNACAIKNGIAYCWGVGNHGALGTNNNSDQDLPTQVQLRDRGATIGISASEFRGCASIQNKMPECWGKGNDGQIGDGSSADSSFPKWVDLSPLKMISAGPRHTCAIQYMSSGGPSLTSVLKCWGKNDVGQLGINTTTPNSRYPLPVNYW